MSDATEAFNKLVQDRTLRREDWGAFVAGWMAQHKRLRSDSPVSDRGWYREWAVVDQLGIRSTFRDRAQAEAAVWGEPSWHIEEIRRLPCDTCGGHRKVPARSDRTFPGGVTDTKPCPECRPASTGGEGDGQDTERVRVANHLPTELDLPSSYLGRKNRTMQDRADDDYEAGRRSVLEGAVPVEVTWDSAKATYLIEPTAHVPLNTTPGPYWLVGRNRDGGDDG